MAFIGIWTSIKRLRNELILASEVLLQLHLIAKMPKEAKQESPSVLLFPFPSSGHVIPLLDFANLLLGKGLKITILITPENLPLLEPLRSKHPSGTVCSLILPFPETYYSPGLPLPARIRESSKLYDPVLQWFQSQTSPPIAIVSDFFLGWTYHLAAQLGVPRLAFWTSCAQSFLIMHHLWRNHSDYVSDLKEDSLITFHNLPNSPVFPFLHVSQLITQCKKGDDPEWDFFNDNFWSNLRSWGLVFNSFEGFESDFMQCVKKHLDHERVWAVGPLFFSSINTVDRGGSSTFPLQDLMTWLDDKAANSVVYVCFGTRVALTSQQIDALGAALECSGVHFIWCDKKTSSRSSSNDRGGRVSKEYEDRAAGKGLIIRGWAPQVKILRHRSVGAFLTHCGWNSVLEGVSAGVVLLTWPMGSDQYANARLLVDILGLGIQACEGGPKLVPDSSKLSRVLTESVSNFQSKRTRAIEMHSIALRAVQNGGSSNRDLNKLVKNLIEFDHRVS